MASRLFALGMLGLLCTIGATASEPAPEGLGPLSLVHGRDALAGSGYVGPVEGEPAALWLALPQGASLEIDEAYVLSNPAPVARVAMLRLVPGVGAGVSGNVTLDGSAVASVALLPWGEVPLGLVVHATTAPIGSRATVAVLVTTSG